jgi:hypothetical protein
MAKARTLLPFPRRDYSPGERTGRRSSILTLDDRDDIQVSAKVIVDDDGDELLQIKIWYGGGWAEFAISRGARSVIATAKGELESVAWWRLREQLVESGWKL